MEKARILEFDEVTQSGKQVVWLELREMTGAMPVTYYAEHLPFLRFDCEDRVAMITVRTDYYGKTWRCWNRFEAGKTAAEWERA